MLYRASLFITHGGGNSINEAILAGCPMLVIPFFGDQYVSARLVQERTFGFSLYNRDRSDFDNSTANIDIGILANISGALTEALDNIYLYRMHLEYAKLYDERQTNLNKLLGMIDVTFSSIWQPGDLLYGTTVDRKAFQTCYPQHHFHIAEVDHTGRYLTVDKLHIIPCLIDQWNDLLRQYTVSEIKYLLHLDDTIREELLEYRSYLLSSGTLSEANLGHEDLITKTVEQQNCIIDVPLIKMCCSGMRFFISRGKFIHFVIDTMDKDANPGTHMELMYISTLTEDERKHIVYWKAIGGSYICSSAGRIEPAPYVVPGNIRERYQHHYDCIRNAMAGVSAGLKLGLELELQGRIKSEASIARKLMRNANINDLLGYRIITPTMFNIYLLAEALRMQVFTSERGRVYYLYATDGSIGVELQVWPQVLYEPFANEHSTIYKASARSSKQITESIKGRLEAHTILDTK
jgi:hypothetical protein